MLKEIKGSWEIDSEDIESLELYGNVSMEFKDDGELRYVIHSADKDEIILMTYEIRDSLLITDQPSSPRKEETSFNLTSDGKLELFFGGDKSTYVRKSEPKND